MARFAAMMFVLASLLAAPAAADDADYLARPGEALAAFAGETANAGAVAFPAEGAKLHLVHLFACDSDICGEALEPLDAFVFQPMRGRGLAMIAVARDATDADVRALLAERPVSFPILADPDRAIAAQLVREGRGVPRTILADADGRVVWRHDGFSEGRERDIRMAAEAILAGDPVPAALALRTRAVPPAGLGPGAWAGRPAPEFVAEKWINPLPGETGGKFVLYEFWATWCGPCRVVMPHLQELSESHADRLVIKSISNEPEDIVRPFVEQAGYTYPIAIDTQGRTANAVGVRGIPFGMLVDPSGVVVWEGHPAQFIQDPASLDRLLAGGGAED